MIEPIKNAGDPKEVKEAQKRIRSERKDEVNDMLTVLSTLQGRRVMHRILEYCRVFNSVMDTEGRIQYNAGKQDVGHYLMAEIETASPEALFRILCTKGE